MWYSFIIMIDTNAVTPITQITPIALIMPITPSFTPSILPLEKITSSCSPSSSSSCSFHETISLIFHAINSESCRHLFTEIYEEFTQQHLIQTTRWPKLILFRTASRNCSHVLPCDKPFIESQNLLTLLYRLIHIELYKAAKTLDTKIIDHQISFSSKSVLDLSLDEIVDLLHAHLSAYLAVYRNETYIEYQLANTIVSLLE